MTSTLSGPANEYDLDAKYRAEAGQVFLTGTQALVRVPFEQMRRDRAAGLRTGCFVSGYPGSPLGGFDQELAAQRNLMSELDVVHRPGLNEELAATAVMGSQMLGSFGAHEYDGVVGVWYGKAPGLDRASDAIRTAMYPGTTSAGGALAYVGDDPACKSSTLPSNSLQSLIDLTLPTLYPGNMQEVIDFGIHGIAMSRASALWTAIKIDTGIADGAGTADVSGTRLAIAVPMSPDGVQAGRAANGSLSPLTITATERDIFEQRIPIALEYGRLNRLNAITHDAPSGWLGIVAAGHVYYQVVEALERLGLDDEALRRLGVRLLRVGMVYPFDRDLVRTLAAGLDEILVIEPKRPLIETMVRDALYGTSDQPRVLGKLDPEGASLVPMHGVIDADVVTPALVARLTQRISRDQLRLPDAPTRQRIMLPLIPRTPYFCSGCPHNTSLPVPQGSLVGAGIGCHSMVAFLDPERAGNVTGVTMMGGEGAQWIGASPFVDAAHTFQNLGDGTFFHSGSLAIRAAVAAGVNITYKVLYNRAVAMTGGQDPVGLIAVPAMVDALVAEGVQRVIVTTEDLARYRGVQLPKAAQVWERSRIMEAQESLRAISGVTVLVHDQQCAAEARRLRKRGQQEDPTMGVVINHRVCEGCGDCGVQANCLSLQPIETEFGDKTAIDQTSCNKDYRCIDGDCPSFLTVEPAHTPRWMSRIGARRRADRRGPRRDSPRPVVESAELPDPQPIVDVDDFAVRMPGIGGTGVVTVAQVLGTAALLDGRHVASMDQTGLSQKGGAVVSDLRISRTPIEGGNKIVAGSLDLYLVFDVIAGLNEANLQGADPSRTVAVVSTTKTATGLQIGRPNLKQPSETAILSALGSMTREHDNIALDATRLATDLFGRATGANVLLVGIAFQAGAMPLSASAIERAIELNGVAVDANLQAFRYGRLWVIDRERVEGEARSASRAVPRLKPSAVTLVGTLGFGAELDDLVLLRASELIDYQDESYARRYVELVARAVAAEQQVAAGSTRLAATVARNFFKVLAYKDEYEIARLHLLGAADAAIEAAAAGDAVKISWNLHPPTLRALGMDRKLRLGPWFAPAMRALRAGKRLRGTALDPFGRAAMRRLERSLVDEYEAIVDEIIQVLDEDRFEAAVALAALPDMVRGYESVKEASVERYRVRLGELRASITGSTTLARSAPPVS